MRSRAAGPASAPLSPAAGLRAGCRLGRRRLDAWSKGPSGAAAAASLEVAAEAADAAAGAGMAVGGGRPC